MDNFREEYFTERVRDLTDLSDMLKIQRCSFYCNDLE